MTGKHRTLAAHGRGWASTASAPAAGSASSGRPTSWRKPACASVDGRFAADADRHVAQPRRRGPQRHFEWTFSGRFTKRDVAVATVTGTAVIKKDGRVFSRCKTRKPASVRLAR